MHAQAISLRQLRFFVALAELANFSRTAERMAVSQPALSSAIRQLETLSGVRLFDRTTHRVTLTAAGRALLPHAQRVLTTADNAFVEMDDAARWGRATVRIGAIPSAVPAVARAVAALDADGRGITCHLSDGKSDTLVAELRNGALDMAICVASRIEEGLIAIGLMEDEMLLVIPRGHPLDGSERLPWSALEAHEIIHFAGGSIGELSSAAMRQNHLTPSSRYRVDQVDSLFGIVSSGLAVGVMPRLYTRGFDPDQVALIPLSRPTIKRRVVLLHRSALKAEHPLGADLAAALVPELRRRLT